MAIGRISSAKNAYVNQNPVANYMNASGGTESTYEDVEKLINAMFLQVQAR